MKKHLNVKAHLLLLLLLISGNVLAQNNSETVVPREAQYTLAIDPTFLVNYGLKFDFEKRLKHPKQWLQLGIAGYYAEESDTEWLLRYEDENIYGIKGGGLSIGLKDYRITKDKKWTIQPSFINRWYLQPTFTYNYLNVRYLSSTWEQTVEDGLTYHRLQTQMRYKSYNQLNANLLLGLQSKFERIFFYDAYVGLGYRHTIHKKEEDASGFENSNGMYSLGYSGVYFTLGVRFGFEFGRK